MSISDEVLGLFASKGRAEYHGERVSQEEHALQAARQAEEEGAPDALVVAALLHDVGHLLHELGEDAADRGIDDRHEVSGNAWLSRNFGPEVSEPVRLHVEAKRYLCAVDPDYLGRLSQASVRSLELQGGPLDASGVSAFEANIYHRDAVRLRRWDDTAKVAGLDVPGLEHYRDRIEAVARPGGA